MNTKFQNAIQRIPQKCPPIWFMRQAGRYHKHYQKLRAENSFMDLCKKPKLAAEVALGPIEDFDFDVSILFSDLLFPLEAMGMGLDYVPGPKLGWHVSSVEDLKKLDNSERALDQLRFQTEACRETRKLLPTNKSFIGFVGGPWTLFSYAVGGSHEAHHVKRSIGLFDGFCDILLPLLKQNIQLQLDGGVEVVMVLDTSAGDLSPNLYRRLVAPKIKDLVNSFPGRLGYYTKNTNHEHIEDYYKLKNLAGLGVDHRWDLTQVLAQSPGLVQGNFDQQLLFLSPEEFKQEFHRWIEPYTKLSEEQRKGWVCGLGHGVLPQTPEDNVRSFVKMVREVFGG
jgi:uroporphyrinogen decarboxylase